MSPVAAAPDPRFSFRALDPTANAFRIMADLLAGPAAGLPPVEWNIDPVHGVTGTVRGSEVEIKVTVRAWASRFGVKARQMKPKAAWCDGEGDDVFVMAGYVVLHLPVPELGVTVAGRLIELPAVKW